MSDPVLISLLEQYGYMMIYVILGLGPFGLISNEALVLTIGWLADVGVLNSWYAFLCIVAGLWTAVTAGFFIGKLTGRTWLQKLRPSSRIHRYVSIADRWLKSYGKIFLFIGYFVPGVRYCIPFIAGVCGYRYRTFAMFSYVGAVVWSAIFFKLGKYFADNAVRLIVETAPIIIVILGLLFIGFRYFRARKTVTKIWLGKRL